MNIASGSGGEDRWRSKYEESMNPFEAFRGRVSTSFSDREEVLHCYRSRPLMSPSPSACYTPDNDDAE